MSLSPSDDILRSAAEASVVALARAGDQPAFEELVRRHQSSIRNLLRSLCRNMALADDLAQETFLQAWKQLRTLRVPDAFKSWLRKLAINSWRQHLRREGGFWNAAEVEEGDVMSTPAATEGLDLNSALGVLAPSVRLCIVLSYREGMSHSEIAAATQLPLGTVKSHIARGTVRLRKLLAAYDSSHE
ncbi:MAG TPA: sigma-70 family RNA polymerase sigma factor [Silvibacterium sp.]|jgi:RNA polymerase sigma-70 factor (ECF subfamily)|nr:sigma-70 family RNA polymerase sigma factor [Silvibacterium sp.]